MSDKFLQLIEKIPKDKRIYVSIKFILEFFYIVFFRKIVEVIFEIFNW